MAADDFVLSTWFNFVKSHREELGKWQPQERQDFSFVLEPFLVIRTTEKVGFCCFVVVSLLPFFSSGRWLSPVNWLPGPSPF